MLPTVEADSMLVVWYTSDLLRTEFTMNGWSRDMSRHTQAVCYRKSFSFPPTVAVRTVTTDPTNGSGRQVCHSLINAAR